MNQNSCYLRHFERLAKQSRTVGRHCYADNVNMKNKIDSE